MQPDNSEPSWYKEAGRNVFQDKKFFHLQQQIHNHEFTECQH